MTTWLSLKQVGGSANSRGETSRQIRQYRWPTCKQLRRRRQRGTELIGRRAIGIPNIPQALTTGEFFSGFGQVSVAWRNLQPTDGRFDQHSTRTARTELHNMITFHHANTGGASSKDCTSLSTCSLTHFIHFSYLSDSLTFAHKPYDSRPLFTLRCSTAECRTNTNPISHTNCKSQPRFRSECSQPQFCHFFKPWCFFLNLFLSSVSVHVERVKETRFRSQFQFFCTGAGCFNESNKSSCRLTSSRCLQAEGILLQKQRS